LYSKIRKSEVSEIRINIEDTAWVNNCILHGRSVHERHNRGKLYSTATPLAPVHQCNKILNDSENFLTSSWSFLSELSGVTWGFGQEFRQIQDIRAWTSPQTLLYERSFS